MCSAIPNGNTLLSFSCNLMTRRTKHWLLKICPQLSKHIQALVRTHLVLNLANHFILVHGRTWPNCVLHRALITTLCNCTLTPVPVRQKLCDQFGWMSSGPYLEAPLWIPDPTSPSPGGCLPLMNKNIWWRERNTLIWFPLPKRLNMT